MPRYLYIMGGGPRIAYSVGTVWAFEQIGIEFDGIFCVSAGTLVGMYYACKKSQVELLQLVIRTFSRQSPYILPSNGLLFDIKEFTRNMEIFPTTRVEVVSTILSGQSRLDPLSSQSLLATMAIPGVTCAKYPQIDGVDCIDGSINLFPTTIISGATGPAHITVLPNRSSLGLGSSAAELYWGLRAGLNLPPAIIMRALTRRRRFREAVKIAPSYDLEVEILWPEGPDLTFENTEQALYSAASQAAESTLRRFGHGNKPFPKTT